jgi:hypothetical protein
MADQCLSSTRLSLVRLGSEFGMHGSLTWVYLYRFCSRGFPIVGKKLPEWQIYSA